MRYTHRRFYKTNSMILWGTFVLFGAVVTTVIQAEENRTRAYSNMFLERGDGPGAAHRLRNAATDNARAQPKNAWLLPGVRTSYDDGVYSVHLPGPGQHLSAGAESVGNLDLSLSVGYHDEDEGVGLIGRQQKAFLSDSGVGDIRPEGAMFFMSVGGTW